MARQKQTVKIKGIIATKMRIASKLAKVRANVRRRKA